MEANVGKNGMHSSNVKIIDISGIYQMPLSIYFVFNGQITRAPTVIFGQVVTKRHESLLLNSELVSDHCDALSSV
jgi:hypothetical protein